MALPKTVLIAVLTSLRPLQTIADRWHSCHVCGLELDRDVNAAINVKNIAVGRTVIKAQRVSDAIAGLAEKPTLYSPRVRDGSRHNL